MTTYSGKNGVVKVGSNAVAEVTEFEVETSVDIVDDTAMGDSWKTHKTGMKEWSGTLTCWWDETDTNGQVVLDEDASVTLSLYPIGATTGNKYITGTATIRTTNTTVTKDGVVTRSFSFTGNGAMSWSTAP